ncbi:hypothetical protein Misp06_01329 [Microbulbifer sp. NBRC 101763]|uniref:phage tail-collar fiber domain-containing protein n=1 Tax=Microbulbifer TaxID=48073 RepID=UPI00037142D0|nr:MULTISPECIES: phage tail protein [Microbulbifer]WHI51677.1 phage tail protein [Microbulbifer sp. MLAF003]
MTLALVLTTAGQKAIVDENNAGTLPVKLSKIALGTGRWNPDASATGLQQEFKRLPTISGNVEVANDMLHITLKDESSDIYDVNEFGLYTDTGILYAVYSVGPGADPVGNKGANSTYLLSLDIKLSGSNADNISVGDTGFSNPTATTERAGVIPIATQAEVNIGSVDDKVVTPKTLHQRLSVLALSSHSHVYATTNRDGFTRLATQEAVDDGNSSTLVVTPKTLQNKLNDNKPVAAGTSQSGIVALASQSEVDIGNEKKKAVTPETLKGYINKQFPGQLIYIWGGEIQDLPAGYKLCNGSNGTRDLRNRFVLGAGDNYSVGATGGATSARTSKNGAHSHAITVNNHTLTLSQIPSHRHHHDLGAYTNGSTGTYQQRWILKWDGGTWDNGLNTYTRYSGGGGAHNHTASASTHDGHEHTVAILPPYYALAYVQRIAP